MSTYSIHHAPAFPDLPEAYRLISFTGGGGKTTLIHWLARSARAAGRTAIVTTTTKIFPPPGERIVLEHDGPDFFQRVRAALAESPTVVAASRFDHATGKLIGLRPDTVSIMAAARIADTVLVEADGAARKPLKAPNAFEPVIPHSTELCVAVMGLDAIGRPLGDDGVHRADIFSRITGRPLEASIRPEDMLTIATAPNGLLKGSPPDSDLAVFLNKGDCPGLNNLDSIFFALLAENPPTIQARWFAGSGREQTCSEITPCAYAKHKTASAA